MFNFKKLAIEEVILIEPQVFSDQRGLFMELYKSKEFAEFGIDDKFLQDNYSKSTFKGTLRGLHFQKKPNQQSKLVRVISGSILDVAVDIRRSSPTYGKWVSEILSSENKKMLYVPVGFAHGFCTLEDNVEIVYKCSNYYSKECDKGIAWDDKSISINWPGNNFILSEKDKKWPTLEEADNNFS